MKRFTTRSTKRSNSTKMPVSVASHRNPSIVVGRVILLLMLSIVLLSLVSCVTTRYVPTESKDSVRIEIRDREIYIRDTVEVYLPAEKVEVETKDTTSTLETSVATSTASVVGGGLKHSLENKKTPIITIYERDTVVQDSIVYREVVNTVIQEVERDLTWWQELRLNAFYPLLGAAVILVLAVLKKLTNIF